MPIIVACPSCGGKLRVGDALLGQKVRCPSCNHVFDSTAEPDQPTAAPRAPLDLPIDLSLDEQSSSSPPAASRGLIGAVEVQRPGDVQPDAAPLPAIPPRQPPPLDDDEDSEWDEPDIRRRGPRRDAEPDRGAVVLTLGIISVAATVIYCIAPVWAILGLTAWIMGQIDLRKMKRGQMDDWGRGMTQAGWICGIVGTALNGLITLGCGLGVGLMWYEEMNRPPPTRPIPAVRPKPVPPPPKLPQPPNPRPAEPRP
jgi:predicted Zn finger-like uncharacterized protein